MNRPRDTRALVALSATVATPFSSAIVENLVCDFGDLLAFRRKLRRFVQKLDEGVVAMHVLMPMFDLALIMTSHGSVRTEIRLSSEVRYERHMYDFESTLEEALDFARMLDHALVSLPLKTPTVS